MSPIDSAILNKCEYFLLNSFAFSFANATNGTIYTAFFPCLIIVFVAANSATIVFPLAVGVQTSKFFPSNNPAFIAFSCDGLNSVMFSFVKTSMICVGSFVFNSFNCIVLFFCV